MPCSRPLQVNYKKGGSGKALQFSNVSNPNLQLPCGRCRDCRIMRSLEWATRCVHEASLYDQNSFITLTFSDEGLKEQAPTGSLDKRHMQLFMKRLRAYESYRCKKLGLEKRIVRTFYGGDYGDKLDRPHYHAALFNFDFPDKVYWKTSDGYRYYTSEILQKLWPYGYSVIGELTFSSAVYIARSCFNKVYGKIAQEHYSKVLPETGDVVQLLPEFIQASLKPGIGAGWYEKHGSANVYLQDGGVDSISVNKAPRYYDKLLERENPDFFKEIKNKRKARHVKKHTEVK